jgi:hypothetical protein
MNNRIDLWKDTALGIAEVDETGERLAVLVGVSDIGQ